MKKILFISVLLFGCLGANAANWREFTSRVYLDLDGIESYTEPIIENTEENVENSANNEEGNVGSANNTITENTNTTNSNSAAVENNTGNNVTNEPATPKNTRKFIFWTMELNDNSKYFSEMEQYYKTRIHHAKTRLIIDCDEKLIARKTITLFDSKNSVVDINNIMQVTDWVNIAPDTVEEGYYNFICQ